MSEPEATGGLPEESGSLPPDYDAPGQVDYPDPAFEDEATEEADFESPDDAEPEPDDDDEDDEDEEESEV
jgi:hypothetical protein